MILLVSIGISFYNAEAYLLDAVRSVFAQTYTDWELILIDDGSTDASLSIARSISDPRVRVYSDGDNRKLPYRLNQITALAKGEFIARMDADDLMSPVRLESQVNFLAENEDIDLISCGVCSLSNDNKPIGLRVKCQPSQIDFHSLLSGASGIVHASVLGRASWFRRNQYNVNNLLAEDYELWIRSFEKGDLKILILPLAYYYYRESGNVSKNKLLMAYESQRKLIWQYVNVSAEGLVALKILVQYYIKSMVVHILASLGKLSYLLDRRNVVFESSAAKQSFEDDILSILNYEVPLIADGVVRKR